MSDKDEIAEVVTRGATDSDLYARFFFPKTARVKTPVFHRLMDNHLDSLDRFVNFQIYRGGAKTTKLRIYTSKRIAYNISKTILYISKSQGHAARNLYWIRNQVENNQLWSGTFQLRPGMKWNDEELQIIHGVDGGSIWVTGMGITGSTRGINFDDYRPDLIIVDDVVDEENSATLEQREKISKLVHGAIRNSLISRMENPFAKMVIAQTPLDFDDISQQALKDPEFVSVQYGCWTPETADLPIDHQESSWPEMFPSEDLRRQKRAAIQKNQLSIFAREMECRLITPESSKFKTDWIKYYGEGEEEPEPDYDKMVVVIAIDPVPPPSEREIEKGLHGKDYEVLAAVGRYQGKYYVLEVSANRGHEPNWSATEFLRLCRRWRPRVVKIEGTAYQKTLKWILEQAMRKVGQYWPVEAITDRRSKLDRIVDGLSGPMSNGKFFFRREQLTVISQVMHYPHVRHDDEIEGIAVATEALQQMYEIDGVTVELMYDESDIPDLEWRGGAP